MDGEQPDPVVAFECGVLAFGAGASDWVVWNKLGQGNSWNAAVEGVEGGGVCEGECEACACGFEFGLSAARDLSTGCEAIGGVLALAGG